MFTIVVPPSPSFPPCHFLLALLHGGGCHCHGLLHVDVIVLPLMCPTVPVMVVVVAVVILLILVITLSQSCHFLLSSLQFPSICCLPCAGCPLLALECWVLDAFRCWSSGFCCLHWPPAVLLSLSLQLSIVLSNTYKPSFRKRFGSKS